MAQHKGLEQRNPEMTLHTRRQGDAVIVSIDGAVVRQNRAELKGLVIQLLEARERHILLDLSRMTFIDSSGLGVLHALHRLAGSSIQLAEPAKDIMLLLESTQMDQTFRVHKTVRDGLIAFAAAALDALLSKEAMTLSPGNLSAVLPTRRGGNVIIVSVRRQLTTGNRAELKDTVLKLFEDGERDIVLDLSTTEYIDSSGLAILGMLRRVATERDSDIRLAAPPEDTATLLELTGTTNVFRVHRKVSDALRASGVSSTDLEQELWREERAGVERRPLPRSRQKRRPRGTSAPKPGKRGFAALDPAKHREISRKGGRVAHWKGTAHEFDSSEAREAAKKRGRKPATRSSKGPES